MSKGAWFTNQWGLELKEATAADDFLHPELCKTVPHPNCCETQFLGFSIPDKGIHAINWVRQHPHMRHLLGGPLVFQGVKQHSVEAQLCDIRLFMTDAVLANDLGEYKLDNGYHVQIIEPMKRLRSSYNDSQRGNSFEVEFTAVMPAVRLAHSGHFEQVMRTTGELCLRGQRHKVDGYTIRNRTWAEARDEAHVNLPPVSWIGCVIDEGLAFSVAAHDHPDLNPIWKDHFKIAPDKVMLSGWLYRDGEVVGLKSIRKITRYEQSTLTPKSFEFVMTDAKGRSYEVEGRVTAACPHNVYTNINPWMCSAEIICNGQRAAQCDFQDLHWTDFLNLAPRK